MPTRNRTLIEGNTALALRQRRVGMPVRSRIGLDIAAASGMTWEKYRPAGLVNVFHWECSALPPFNVIVDAPDLGIGLLNGRIRNTAGPGRLLAPSSHPDPGASPPFCMRQLWPAGFPTGSSPSTIDPEWDPTGTAYRRLHLYASYHMYLQPNSNLLWWAGPTLTKLWFYATAEATGGARNQLFFSIRSGVSGAGQEQAAFDLRFDQQNVHPRTINSTTQPGVGGPYPDCLVVGQDMFLEIELIMNNAAGSVADGTVNAWLQREDGFDAQVFARTDWLFADAADPRPDFYFNKWDPVFGGTGGVSPGEDTFLHCGDVTVATEP